MSEEKYEVKVVYEEAALKVVTTSDPTVVVTITLTSPVMREGDDADHGTCFTSILISQGPNKSLPWCNIADMCFFNALDW